MKKSILVTLIFLASCNTLPQLYDDVEEIATNNAIDVSISKEVVDTEKDLTITIELNESGDK